MNEIAGHFIAGRWREDGEGIGESLNPADGSVLGQYALGSQALTEEAIRAARLAFDETDWAHAPRYRADVLYAYADRLAAQSKELAELLTLENGKAIAEAKGEIGATIAETRYYAGLCRTIFGRSAEFAPDAYSFLNREPAGVVAVIVPWNAPATLLMRSLAPVLAAGCTAIIKPAPQTPLINQRLVEALAGIDGLAPGIVNSVNESGIVVGDTLARHPEVDVITFTGSTRTGKAIMSAASDTLKKLSLELGGKTPAVIFPDADLDQAVAQISRGITVLAGQMCVAVSRVLVHQDISATVEAKLKAALEAVKTGPGIDPANTMGAIIDRPNVKRIASHIDQASREARMILKGDVLNGPGNFVTPSLFAIEDTDSPLVQDELFAPIASFETFADEAEAIKKANATRFGLAASLWTRDLNRAHRVSRRMRFGTVWLNCQTKLFVETETGGYKESGLGRLHGAQGLDDFLETKHVYLEAGTS